MSVGSNKALARRFLTEIWNNGDLDVADEIIHPDYMVPGFGPGPEAVKQLVASYRAAFADLEWRVEQMLGEGDWVAVRLTLHGVHQGEFRGIAPTGKMITMGEIVFWQIADGKIRTIFVQADNFGLYQQLGSFPPA